jgi:Protein of unknown function (DUF2752)
MEIDFSIGQKSGKDVELSTPQTSKPLALFAVIGLFAVFLISVLFTPSTRNSFTVCGFKTFTGLPCPGCGLTHSFCALGKGNVLDAFGFNLLGPPLFVTLVFLWVRSACVLLNKTSVVAGFARVKGRFNLVKVFAVSFAVYGIARIVYLLVYQPIGFNESPMSRLIARLIH